MKLERGPLAGPVVAASVILADHSEILGLNDSKQLTAKKRAQLFQKITEHSVAWAFSVGSSSEVDTLNIRGATLLAMQRSVLSLRIQPEKVLVDGRDVIDVPMACESVIKGDQKEPAIMAASIIAKHMRDRLMLCLSQRFLNMALIDMLVIQLKYIKQ